ncbi:hypothetical protein GV054_18810 [Marinomonas mediterranea]|uniref:hypothetical protein n=1 Tax=Marinomonas mediterranea TaxID=119864 RepID=UPI00234B1A56|nr:hypothetical protein [Marinomonas mediterranea]WCN14911.1 hypothetical protein GV054_18810 [Marinomonas mediterranea]
MSRTTWLASYQQGDWCLQTAPNTSPIPFPELETSFSAANTTLIVAIPDAWIVHYQEEVDPAYDDELCYLAAATFASEVCAVTKESLLFRYQLNRAESNSPILSIEAVAMERLDGLSRYFDLTHDVSSFLLESDVSQLDIRTDAVRFNAFKSSSSKSNSSKFSADGTALQSQLVFERYDPVMKNRAQWWKKTKRFMCASVLLHASFASFYCYAQHFIPNPPAYVSPWASSDVKSASLSEQDILGLIRGISKTIRLDAFSWIEQTATVRLTGTQDSLSALEAQFRKQLGDQQLAVSKTPIIRSFARAKQESLYEATFEIY